MSHVTPEGMMRLIHEVLRSAPHIVVHPADAEAVSEVAAQLRIKPVVEVNEWAVKPGNVMVFIGTQRPITNLGSI